MSDLDQRDPDFEAEVTILTATQGGRRHPPYNHIRWDFGYLGREALDPIYMIWPIFLDERGIVKKPRIECVGVLRTQFYIVDRDMVDFHKTRIHIGMGFTCHEGQHIVATGKVTKLRRLAD